MLLKQYDLKLFESGKFKINPKQHSASWLHYYRCYSYTIKVVFRDLLNMPYPFNPKTRPLMFLLRHNLELCLKMNLSCNGVSSAPNKHNFEELLNHHSMYVPKEFIDTISLLDFDRDGSCFRYYLEKESRKPYFSADQVISLASYIKMYNEIKGSENFLVYPLFGSYDETNKTKWALTLHLGLSSTLGHVKSQYDELISFLIDGILERNYDIKKIYIPLFFLIRHSLELGLKYNIEELCLKNCDYDHRLSSLYNFVFGEKGYFSKLSLDQISNENRRQYLLYRDKFHVLQSQINQLDKHSYNFRFPFNLNNKPHTFNVKDNFLSLAIKLYSITDPFLTFVVDIFRDEGLIPEPFNDHDEDYHF